MFTGNPSGNDECIEISLLSDNLIEPTETFTIELTSDDSALFIAQSSAEIMLQDNTGMFIWQTQPSFNRLPTAVIVIQATSEVQNRLLAD